MVKGKKKQAIVTKEEILKKVSTYDIYRFYQGPFELNEVCINKYRGEKDPSLIIGTKLSVDLTHKDFGDYSWRGDAFSFVQQIYRCDFVTALKMIDRDMMLGIADGSGTEKPVITWGQPKIVAKKPPFFQVSYYSSMPKRGLDYWSKLEQGEEDLKRENVFFPRTIWRNKIRVPVGDRLVFGYYYEDVDKWKIYRPFSPKRTLSTPIYDWKWDSNVPFNYIDNISSITPDCKTAILSKSKKDRMVLMKALNTNCIADIQAEDPSCLSDNNLDKFMKIERRICVMDNDKKGKEVSWWLTKEKGFKHVNVPDNFLTSDPKCTDFADLCYHYGINKVIEHFKNKGILC